MQNIFIKRLLSSNKVLFVLIGFINTCVNYMTYALLLFCGVQYLVSNTIAFLLSVFSSFCLNKLFVFKTASFCVWELCRFILVYVVMYFVGILVLFTMVDILHCNLFIAGLFNIGVSVVISYVGHSLFSFRKFNLSKQSSI